MPLERTETADLPLEECEPYPKAMMRFEYGPEDPTIAALAQSILAQNQLQRGRVVPKPGGKGKWLYIGTRRYFAIKFLQGKPGAPAVYRAEIDYGLTEDEIITRALMENEEGRGERKPISVEEELAYYRLLLQDRSEDEVISICEKAGKDTTTMTRSIRIARTFGSDKLRKLYEIEKKSGFRFALAHTEEFTKLPDDKTIFQVAAVTADKKFDPGAVKPEAARELVKSIVWFPEVFPEYATAGTTGGNGGGGTITKKGGKVAEPTLDFIQCPHCGAQNPFKHKVKMTFTFMNELKADGRVVKKSVEPLGLFITPVECLNPKCIGAKVKVRKKGDAKSQFWAAISFREEDAKEGQERARRVTLVQRYSSEADATTILSSLKGRAVTGAMRFDSKSGRYMVLDDKERLFELDDRYRFREATESPGGRK